MAITVGMGEVHAAGRSVTGWFDVDASPPPLRRMLIQIAAEWATRGFSCDLWTDPPGQRRKDFTHATDEVVIVLEGEMEATFREALAARLAMEWAEPLSQTSTVGEQMASLYRNKLQVARVADGQEDRIKSIHAPDFIDARF